MGGGGPRGGGNSGSFGGPRGNGGGFNDRNDWGAPMNGNGNMMNQPPPNMMAHGNMGGNNQGPMGGGGMGQNQGGPQGGGGKTSTQVTIPKDVSYL